jgi:hypothetical protein
VGDYLPGGFNNEPTARFSKWNRTNWVHISAVPCRSRGGINALWASDTFIYVAGLFGLSCEESDYVLLKGDGTNWSTVGRVDGQVYAILESGTNVYLGGRFSMGGLAAATNVARWDGVRWSSIGGGIRNDRGDAFVSALAVDGDRLFVGGFFQFAGSAPANNVACWNGSEWSALGSGVNDDYVRSLAVIGHDLYVGGSFSRAGGVPASNVARWDGTNWSALGSGTSHSVHALAANGDALFVSGDFTEAGRQPSIRFAIWYARPELRADHISDVLELSWPLFGSNYVLEASDRIDVPTWNESSGGVTAAVDRWTVHELPTDLRQFYRLRRKQP